MITLVSDLYRTSFSVIGRLYRRLFTSIGYEVDELPTPTTTAQRFELARDPIRNIIFHNTMGRGFEPINGAYNIALPVHEWSCYPDAWVKRLNRFHEIWVTSQHVFDLLFASGVTTPMYWLPPALNDELIPPKKNWEAAKPFRFYFCGEHHFRKGLHLLMQGFMRAFPLIGIARLTIKTSSDCPWRPTREDIRLDLRPLDRSKLLAEYRRHDCYITASLGEGLGLPVAEAINAGLPVAANHWGGHASLLREEGFFPIRHDIAMQPYCSNPEFYADGQKCAMSRPEDIAQTMRMIVDQTDSGQRQSIAHIARKYLVDRYGFEVAVARIRYRLELIEQHLHLRAIAGPAKKLR